FPSGRGFPVLIRQPARLVTALAAEAVAAGQECVAAVVVPLPPVAPARVRRRRPARACTAMQRFVQFRFEAVGARALIVASALRIEHAAGFGKGILVRRVWGAGVARLAPGTARAGVSGEAGTAALGSMPFPSLPARGRVQPFPALLQVLRAGFEQALGDGAELAHPRDMRLGVWTPGLA